MTTFAKHSILDVSQGSEYASRLLKLFYCGYKRDAQERWYMPNSAAITIIVFLPNWEFPPYSESYMEVKHSS